MKAKILILISCLCCLMPLYGQAPDKETVYRVVNVNMNTRFPGGAREIEKLDTLFYNNEPDLFVVNLAGGGWILVSGDKKAVPVLGYNYEGQFFTGERNVNIASSLWLTSYAEQIKDLRKTKGLPVHDGWNADAKNDNWGEEKKLDIDPLIKAEWNQGAGWNRFCPEDSEGPGGRTYVGCVAVALAQALSVYAVPDTGTGSKLYYPEHYGMPEEYGVIEARFNETHYKWDFMSMDVADDYNALLLFHCAVSVTMKFGPNGSSARTSDTRLAMMDYFKMSRQSYYWIRSYHEDEWVETIINDLKMGRPLIYAGNAGDGTSGHAFNIDGVKPGNYFHLNWGWGGSRNGYYLIDDLKPGSRDYSKNHKAVFGIQPYYYPRGVSLDENTVPVDQPSGSFIARLEVIDEAADNEYEITLLSDSAFVNGQWLMDYCLSNDTLRTGRIFKDKDIGFDKVKFIVRDKYDNCVETELELEVTYVTAVSATLPFNGMQDEIRIYPNPAGNVLNVDFESDRDLNYIRVYSLSGSLVRHIDRPSGHTIIYTAELGQGLYVLEIVFADCFVVRKKVLVL